VLLGTTPVAKPPLLIFTAAAFVELHVAEVFRFLRAAVAVRSGGADGKVVRSPAKNRIDLPTLQLFSTFLALKFASGESRRVKITLVEAAH
jgi:hypothetical protein